MFIFILPSVMKPENIFSEIPSAFSTLPKTNILVSCRVKLCTQVYPLLLTTAEDLDNQLERAVVFCAKPKKNGLLKCGRSFPVTKKS